MNNFIYGLSAALFLSLFIYLDHFSLSHPLINTLFGLTGFFMILRASRRQLIFAGFFTGIFWFYWIALSFRYYDLAWMIPFVVFGIGAVYGVLFYLLGRLHPLLRIAALVLLGYLPLLGFDWFRPELVFVDSYLGIQKWQFGIVLLSLYLSTRHKGFLLFVLLALDFSSVKEVEDSNIQPLSTQIAQDQKWQPKNREKYTDFVINQSRKAAQSGKRMIIFPESFITDYLNKNKTLIKRLKRISRDITIVTGSLYLENGRAKNSAYIFQNGQMEIAHKVVLVPFGEANPLPAFLSDIINDIFYDGAPDYESAAAFTTFSISKNDYTAAICYEATDYTLYTKNPKRVIAISNNAWFTPSVQPTLQKLLMAHFVRLHGVRIYHSANASPSFILKKVQ